MPAKRTLDALSTMTLLAGLREALSAALPPGEGQEVQRGRAPLGKPNRARRTNAHIAKESR